MHRFLIPTVMLLVSTFAHADQGKVVTVRGPAELAAYYDSIGYNVRTNPKVLQAIPRTQFTRVPQNWKWNEGGIPLKKSAFFRAAASGILQVNELIFADRRKLEALNLSLMGDVDQAWFLSLAKRYSVEVKDPSSAKIELLMRVDAIPVSLALAQSAVESGWGGSRFARKGNALFGQWTTSGGIKAKGSNARLATFATPGDSLVAYMRNLNTHGSYAGLRKARAARRAAGKSLSGHAAAAYLSSYAETGQEYVELLQGMIKHNGLGIADGAALAETPVVTIKPIDPK